MKTPRKFCCFNCRILLCVLSFNSLLLFAQETTVGLLQYSEETSDGYTLFAPMLSSSTYLINNCGEAVHTWESDSKPGLSVYLLENGNLLRTERTANGIGLSGGRIVELDWEGNIVWEFNLANDSTQLHHDIEPLPNGNILAIVAKKISETEVENWGRNPDYVGEGGMLIDYVIEIEPLENNQANIVWQWNVQDHLVQDFDATKANFGNVNLEKEKLDINFNNGITIPIEGNGEVDFNHTNSIDYNEELDQILLSSRFFNEIWIIDHSTTSQEAATNMGGNSGKGGGLLFRWGNGQAYKNSNAASQQLFGQHHAEWVKDSNGIVGKNIILFNNGVGRLPAFSEIIEINTSFDEDGNYTFENSYLPENPFWQYAPADTIFSRIISGVQRLSNGNTLICDGTTGRFFEINESETIIWDYINPISVFGAIIQGNIPTQNSVFRATKYTSNYPAFEGKDLSNALPLELNPIPNICGLVSSTETVMGNFISIKPNLFTHNFSIEMEEYMPKMGFTVYNVQGYIIFESILTEKTTINTQNWQNGIYFVLFDNGQIIKCFKQ